MSLVHLKEQTNHFNKTQEGEAPQGSGGHLRYGLDFADVASKNTGYPVKVDVHTNSNFLPSCDPSEISVYVEFSFNWESQVSPVSPPLNPAGRR